MRCADVIEWLKTKYPGIGIYNGTIPKNEDQCIGIYLKERGSPVIAVGGLPCTSTAILPVSILVHWGQDADICEAMAQGIYDRMLGNVTETIGGAGVTQFALQDSSPVDISRDENNICEMVIRVNIVYER
ncbi:MAG: minor capsid protein [Ethanoligenens sp.]